ncbi:MAG: HPr(Ser) kinase/phosphatase [Clostridia bacterium]|nr:HPr(Ser) kinase/phosphatase [Clostridia bacterium]
MSAEQKLTLADMMQPMAMEAIYMPIGGLDREITSTDINRPALQLVGFFDYFDETRIQVLGMVEHTYLDKQDPEERRKILDRFFSFKFPALVITRSMDCHPEVLEVAEKYKVPVLRSSMHTAQFVSGAIFFLNDRLGPQLTMHGVLVEVYGEGILLTGESGVGKSETAIELVKRGHRLIADDAVVVKRVTSTTLKGTAPSNIQYFIELRGIGIINARKIFGIGAVKEEAIIDMEIHLENWDQNKIYDRLGMDTHYTNILDVDVPTLTIPVKPGRNLAIIIEVAAMNNRQKRLGYNAADEINKLILGIAEDD